MLAHRPLLRPRRARPALAAALLALASLTLPRALATASQPPSPRVPGLRAEVRIVTDRWGIPHVRARSLADLYRAWGWLAARDRLWQMMWSRAAGDGHAHRWVGNTALPADGGAQLFRLRERADALWQRSRRNAQVREALTEYAAGVNAYLASCRRGERAWPAEFRRLRARPRDWQPADCVLVMLGFGITLDLDLPELGEAASVARLGRAAAWDRRRFENRWIYDTIPDSAARRMWGAGRAGRAEVLEPAAARAGRELGPATRAAIDRLLAAYPPRDADGADRASNAFVVGARRSASGKPILANDPHLGLASPGPFHVVHLSVPGMLDAAGASVAGLPIVASGRNARVAWGVTALSADVIDVFADTLSADGKRVKDLRGGGARWVPVQAKPFDLRYRVLGIGLPVLPFMQVRRYTPRGPVVAWDPKRRVALTAQWTALRDERISLDKLFGIERAVRTQQVIDAFASLVTPCFNVVAADVDGDVRYRAVGLLPDRASDPGPGPIPSDGRHEWRGLVAAGQMPGWAVPANGFAVNGNNRPAGVAYPHVLPRFDWPQDRARRMAQRLGGDASITAADAMSVQNDVLSLAAERNVPALLRAADSLRASLPPRARAALDTLRGWDRYARRSKVAPTLYRAWFGAFQRRSQFDGFPGLALATLEGRVPELTERPAVAACSALVLALDTLAAKLGPDLGRWHYRRAHQARFRHGLSMLDPRSRWEPPLLPEDGDNATPSVGASRLPFTVEVTHGPVFRHVVDLARPHLSWAVVPPWNSVAFPVSGDLDHRGRWASHGYIPLHMDWARIEEVAMDRTSLAP